MGGLLTLHQFRVWFPEIDYFDLPDPSPARNKISTYNGQSGLF